MISRLKKIGLTAAMAILVFVSAPSIDPIQTSHAAPTSADISARITQISGLQPGEIDQIYAAEQAPDLVLIAYDVSIPVIIEPLTGYLLVRVAATGEWIRVFIDTAEWNTDFRAYLAQVGVPITRQPKGTIDSLTPAAEAAQIDAATSLSGGTIANIVLYGSPAGPGGAPAPVPSPHIEPDPGQASALVSDQIGTTTGEFRVGESGAATYSIPIFAASGTAGVAPEVSLNYSSSSGNGVAGLGWSVGGLSAIARCRSTLGQDSQARAISWTNADQFCLDGQRLIKVSGAQGANGSIYRTELDGGVLVTVVGVVNGGPDYFKVQRKDGSTSYYGKSPNSSDASSKLNNSAGQTLTWAIRHFTDSVGNPIWYDYETVGGAQRIKNVKYAYGANKTNPAAHNARIEFDYGSRPDPVSGYVSGFVFGNDKRLAAIRSYNTVGTEQLIRQYNLAYGEGHNVSTDNVSRLTSVQECVGSACLPKTTFGWRVPTITSQYHLSPGFTMANSNHGMRAQRPADIDGDGKIDLVWLEASYGSNASNMNPRLNYAVSTGDDFVQQPFVGSSSAYCPGTGQREICYAKVSSHLTMKLETFDFNIDGRSDVGVYDYAAGVWKIYLSVPQGDGSWRLSGIPVSTPAVGGNLTDHRAHFFDANSDGLVDVVSMNNWNGLNVRYMEVDPGQSISSSRYYRFGAQEPFNHTSPFWTYDFGFWGILYNKLEISGTNADFNGDGRVDFMLSGKVDSGCSIDDLEPGVHLNCTPPESVNVALVTTGPNSFAKYAAFPGWIPGKRLQTVDINSDGLTDVVYPTSSNTFYYRINQGNGTFSSPVSLGEPTMGQNPQGSGSGTDDPQFVDWNMDGYLDLVWKITENSTTNAVASIKLRYWNPDSQSYDPVATSTVMPVARKSKNESVMFADMNGDGTPEMNSLQHGLSGESYRYKAGACLEQSSACKQVGQSY